MKAKIVLQVLIVFSVSAFPQAASGFDGGAPAPPWPPLNVNHQAQFDGNPLPPPIPPWGQRGKAGVN